MRILGVFFRFAQFLDFFKFLKNHCLIFSLKCIEIYQNILKKYHKIGSKSKSCIHECFFFIIWNANTILRMINSVHFSGITKLVNLVISRLSNLLIFKFPEYNELREKNLVSIMRNANQPKYTKKLKIQIILLLVL